MILKDKSIIVVSNEPWGDVWFSKHNWAFELSKSNDVFFVNSPGKWKISNLFKLKINVHSYSETLKIISINNIVPSKSFFLKKLNAYINSKRIIKLIKNKKKDVVFWTFTPLVFFNPKHFNPKLSIFHIVDEGWKKFYGTELLASKVDVLLFVSELILNEYKEFNQPKLVIPHGISEDEFALDNSELNSIKKEVVSLGKFGIFVGSIDKRLDFILLQLLFESFPDTNFVFVGPLNLGEGDNGYDLFNHKFSNVILLGSKPYKKIKYYINLAHFCLSPMNMSFPGNHISHHKTIPYLAQGKPIFSPAFKAYLHQQELMYMDDKHDGLKQLLNGYLKNGEDDVLADLRIKEAKKHSFDHLKSEVEVFLSGNFKN